MKPSGCYIIGSLFWQGNLPGEELKKYAGHKSVTDQLYWRNVWGSAVKLQIGGIRGFSRLMRRGCK